MRILFLDHDKALHVVYGVTSFVFAFIVLTAIATQYELPALMDVRTIISLVASFAMGVTKEAYDWYRNHHGLYRRHNVHPLDVVATTAGGFIAAIPTVLV